MALAQRYKDYNEIRSKLTRESTKPIPSPSLRKRKHPASDPVTVVHTPIKRSKTLGGAHPSIIDPYDPPIAFLLSPSQQKSRIGPTPQRDGQILGMFDGLSSRGSKATPAKRTALGDGHTNIQMTPSKHQTPIKASTVKDGLRRTQSMGNLDVKATPSTQRIIASCTPGTGSAPRKLRFDDTPAFLRRDSLQVGKPKTAGGIDDDFPSFSPFASKMRRHTNGRSLSAIMQGMRDEEEERLDEEFDLMREMEDDEPIRAPPVPKILVEDSQAIEMPLGPDREIHSDENMSHEERDDTGAGKTTKTWKKRGQKRSTRHVKMRPNTAKWQPEAAWKGDDDDDEGGGDNAQDGTEAVKSAANAKEKPSVLTKAKRKISATAHANFRALKIRNKNSKFKRGGGRRNR